MIEAGSVIQNRYRVVKPLGEGGMGAVYRAWDLRLKVPVALKEMRPQPGLDDELLSALRQQFQQEASVLARLNHPHLVRVTDYFEESDEVFLVMDFVAGESLAEILLKEGPQPENQVLEWAKQLLSALTYCHTQGVIHRDIKPQNIIIKEDGSLTLVDFGLVKLWDPNDPRTKTVMRGLGTPEYAPPEQYGASVDHTGPPSDLYSLGATLYHALTGQSPPTATERMAIPDQFIPLRNLAPNVSVGTEKVVMKALELSVPMRWQTASEMATAFTNSGDMVSQASTIPSPFIEGGTEVYIPTQRVGTTPSPAPPIGTSAGAVPASNLHKRKKWPVALGIVGGVLCVIAACLGVIIGLPIIEDMLATVTPQSVTPIMTQPTNTPTPITEIILGEFSITFDNQSPYDICYVFISPVDSDSWGEDWLDSEQVIGSGATFSFNVTEGSYDILAETCDEATLATAWNLQSNTTLMVGGPGLVPIRIVNNLAAEACYLFISPVSSDEWGQDWLGDIESIPSGGSRIVFVQPDTYDFSVMNCEEEEISYQYDVIVYDEVEWVIE